jgi:hypothetical protein
MIDETRLGKVMLGNGRFMGARLERSIARKLAWRKIDSRLRAANPARRDVLSLIKAGGA